MVVRYHKSERRDDMVNSYEIGRYLQTLRKAQGRTQKELADQLGVSFQAVSKWEKGDSFPDVALLLPLANELQTTTDKILSGGLLVRPVGKRIRMDTIVEGLNALKHLRDYFGAKSVLYRGAMEGIS